MKTDMGIEELLKIKEELIGGQLCTIIKNGRAGLYGEIVEIAGQTKDVFIAIDVKNKGRCPFFLPRHYSLSRIKLGLDVIFIAWSWNEDEREKFILTPK